MKRGYQIDQQRPVQQFRRLAQEQNPNIQMIFPWPRSWASARRSCLAQYYRNQSFSKWVAN